jgi:hypothetical protein
VTVTIVAPQLAFSHAGQKDRKLLNRSLIVEPHPEGSAAERVLTVDRELEVAVLLAGKRRRVESEVEPLRAELAMTEKQMAERRRLLTLLDANPTLYAEPYQEELDIARTRCKEIEGELAALAARRGEIKLLSLPPAESAAQKSPTPGG